MSRQSPGRIVEDRDEALQLLAEARRIAVLGIKPETKAGAPAYFVPAYLKRAGYEVVPVPTYYPDVTRILEEPVYRTVSAVPGDIDLVVVFRRSGDVPAHVADLIAKKPRAVWFQLGIRNEEAARELAAAGIDVVQDRCSMVDHRTLRRAS